MKKGTIEDWIIIVCLVAFILIWLWVITGCSTQQAKAIDMIWIGEGKCILIGEGMSATQADEVSGEFLFSECEVEMSESRD